MYRKNGAPCVHGPSRSRTTFQAVSAGMLGALLLAVLALGCSPAAQTPPPASSGAPDKAAVQKGKYTIRFGVNAAENTAKGDATKAFAKLVEEKTNGEARVEVLWAAAAGNDRQATEAVKNRGIEMCNSSVSNFAGIVKQWTVWDMPFLINDRAGMYKVMESPLIQEKLLQPSIKEHGIRVMFYIHESFRHLFTTKKKVVTPDDMKGMKLRTTASPLESAYVKAFGGIPTVVDWGETYLALKQGMADGYNVPNSAPVQYAMKDALKYGLQYTVVPGLVVNVINESYYQSLPAHIQKGLDEAAKAVQPICRKIDEETDQAYVKEMRDSGIEITDPTAAQREQWVKLVEPVYTEYQSQLPPGWIEGVRAIQK